MANLALFFSVIDYGARGDGKKLTDGSITSGTAILTSPSNPFLSTDVGKSIRLAGAGAAGADLLTTILSYQSAGQVTIATNASTTISAKEIYYGTDNQTAIQAAIDDVIATQGFGKIYFPYDLTGKYYLFGALVTSVDGINPNCQIYIPKSTLTNTTQYHVGFEGEYVGTFTYGGAAQTEYISGIIIESMITGSGTAPAVLACSFNDTGAGGVINFTHTSTTFKNLCVKVRSKTGVTHISPQLSAIDMSKCIATQLTNVIVVTQSPPRNASVLPTDTNIVGIHFPGILNSTHTLGASDQIASFGFYWGFKVYDHTTINKMDGGANVGFIGTGVADGQGVTINHALCQGAISVIDFLGNNSIKINYLRVEDQANGGWYAVTKHFKRTGGPTTGVINYDIAAVTLLTDSFSADAIGFINVEDKRGDIMLRDYGSASGNVGMVFTDFPKPIKDVVGANYSQSLQIMPVGTGGSATSKSFFALYKTDSRAAPNTFEMLQMSSQGTNGYIINVRANGGGTVLYPLHFQMDGTTRLSIATNGGLALERTITAGGTTGNQTINKMAGTVNFAAAATTITVTNSLCTTSSIVFAVVRTNDSTATIKNVVAGSGSFVITLTAGATAETSVGFWLVN